MREFSADDFDQAFAVPAICDTISSASGASSPEVYRKARLSSLGYR